MRDGGRSGPALRWWDSLRPAERIVAMSLVAGGIIAVVNSTVWAVAVCYMTRQRTLAATARAEARPLTAGDVSPDADASATSPLREWSGGAQ